MNDQSFCRSDDISWAHVGLIAAIAFSPLGWVSSAPCRLPLKLKTCLGKIGFLVSLFFELQKVVLQLLECTKRIGWETQMENECIKSATTIMHLSISPLSPTTMLYISASQPLYAENGHRRGHFADRLTASVRTCVYTMRVRHRTIICIINFIHALSSAPCGYYKFV